MALNETNHQNNVGKNTGKYEVGTIFILRKGIGVGWWSRKWQFSLTLCNENVLT